VLFSASLVPNPGEATAYMCIKVGYPPREVNTHTSVLSLPNY